MPYIKCENLILGYEGTPVAENISFMVDKGDYLCIVGENGAGKSTLMKTLLGLTPLMGGSITYGDGLKAHEIGYLPQQTFVQKDFPASVWEIVLSGTLPKCGRRPFFHKEQKQLAEENMKRMDIWDLKKECYRNLSGGQQQRVLLARALCASSRLLVLDEPVTGLDPKVTAEFYQLIEDLNKEGLTIIMVSHDIRAAVKYASHILHVEKEKSFIGTTKEYVKSDFWKELGGDLA
ncbi:MAG: metal ABC transporter ATP-binding protein [Lachnospiraceae bacterium]|nr:metal ABC transporter ATP-binding protein [Lachnospiraceae bacterium]MBO5146061.1 metal ABC transporter ATP-binding protein [Lachnospiraceae bacterium]